MITAKEAREIVEEARLKEEKRQEALVEPCLRRIIKGVGTASAQGENCLVLCLEEHPEIGEHHARELVFKELRELGYDIYYTHFIYSIRW